MLLTTEYVCMSVLITQKHSQDYGQTTLGTICDYQCLIGDIILYFNSKIC